MQRGSTCNAWREWNCRPRTRHTRSSPRWHPARDPVGERHKLESRRSACCLTSRRESAVFNYYFARNSGRARKNSCCGGRRPMVNYREIVRQQYNFSLPGMTSEFEDYAVELAGVTALELRIVPDINRGDIRAS